MDSKHMQLVGVLLLLCAATGSLGQTAFRGPATCRCSDFVEPVCCQGQPFENICWARCADHQNCREGACTRGTLRSLRAKSVYSAAERRLAAVDEHSKTAGTTHTTDTHATDTHNLMNHTESKCGGHDGGHHKHPTYHYALVFMFAGIALGALTLHVLARRLPGLPYTAVLLVEGVLIAFIDEGTNHGLGAISTSIKMWEAIDPHLLLFAFLPALLFGDAMSLNVHMFRKCFLQCLLLAGPGVLLGSFLTAAVAKYMLPYNWDWNLSMVVGAILAATDPVAVVALLQQLGASPILTMQITGESLLNDGTAIVVFAMFFEMYSDCTKLDSKAFTAGGIVEFFAQLALGGPTIGILFGSLTTYWMRKASRRTVHSDMTIQIALTFCCAYLSFFVAEAEAKVSGVLSTVFAALVLASGAWPSVCNEHTMHHVWHAVEYLGNTLIFLLAGLITGKVIWIDTKAGTIQSRDYGYVVAMYFAMSAIRGLLIALARPVLPLIGYSVTAKDCLFMTWGGLRGAVGLALAMVVRNSIDPQEGSRVIFFVSGLATLTLLVNGVSSGPLLRMLGMVATPHAKKALLANVRKFIRAEVDAAFEELHATDRFKEIPKKDVTRFVHVLTESDMVWLPHHAMSLAERDDDGGDSVEYLYAPGVDGRVNLQRMKLVREIFLHVLSHEYWHEVESGSLPRKSHAVLMLLTSVDCAVDPDSHDQTLRDWEFLEHALHVPAWKHKVMGGLDAMIPKWAEGLHDRWYELHDWWITDHEETAFFVCTSFILAHRRAQKKTCDVFGGEGADSPEEVQVVEESQAEVVKAQTYLASLDPELVHLHKVKNLARMMLEVEHKKIERLCSDGLLTPKESEEMMEQVTQDLHEISVERKLTSKRIAHNHTLRRKQARLSDQDWMQRQIRNIRRTRSSVFGMLGHGHHRSLQQKQKRELLSGFYELHDPEQLEHVDEQLRSNSWGELTVQLEARYGVALEQIDEQSNQEKQQAAARETKSNTKQQKHKQAQQGNTPVKFESVESQVEGE